jgi:hypothetical protein
MKKIIMTLTAMLTLTMMSDCITKENAENTESDVVEADYSNIDNDDPITPYQIDNFSEISISGIVHAVIKQGENYDVRVSESPNPKIKTRVEKKGNTLNVFTETKEKRIHTGDAPTLYVTLPSIKGVRGSGATVMTLSNLTTGDMDIDLSGAAKATFGDMKCGGLDIDCSGASKLDFGKVKCESLKGDLSGASNMTLAANVNGDIDLDNSGACKQNLHLSGKNLRMENNGASSCEVSFKGVSANVSCSGAGKMQLDVDCEELKASNSGASKFTISGTADKTDIDASGAAKINTKQLNQM